MLPRPPVTAVKQTKDLLQNVSFSTAISAVDVPIAMVRVNDSIVTLVVALQPKVRAFRVLRKRLTPLIDRLQSARNRRQQQHSSASNAQCGNLKREISAADQPEDDIQEEQKRRRFNTISDPGKNAYSGSTATPPDNVQIMGSLSLPHPEHCGLSPDRVAQILALLPDIRDLDSRDLHSKLHLPLIVDVF